LTSYKGSAQSPDNFELTPILSIGIFVGILVAIVCIGIGTIAALKLRSHKHQQQQKFVHPNAKFSRPGNLQIKDKISLPLSHSEEMYDEKNPDVVPYNEGKFPVLGPRFPVPCPSFRLLPPKINGVCPGFCSQFMDAGLRLPLMQMHLTGRSAHAGKTNRT